MKCRKKEKRISAYIDGELDAEKAENVKKHLLQCAECTREWNLLKHTDSLVAGLPQEQVSEDFVRNLMIKSAEIRQTRTWSSRLLYFFDTIFLFKKKNSGTLDEFGDFPPCSLSRVYFNLI